MSGNGQNFYKISGREFWTALGKKPYALYVEVLNRVLYPLKRLKQGLTENFDAEIKDSLCGEGRPCLAYIKVFEDTVAECPVKSEKNQEPLAKLKECIDILNEMRGMGSNGVKVCRTCGRSLTIDHFYKKAVSKDGHDTECKECAEKRRIERNERKKRGEVLKSGKPSILAQYSKKPVAPTPAPTPATTQAKSLQDYTPRELMAELARRGYTGKLEYVERHIIDITNF